MGPDSAKYRFALSGSLRTRSSDIIVTEEIMTFIYDGCRRNRWLFSTAMAPYGLKLGIHFWGIFVEWEMEREACLTR